MNDEIIKQLNKKTIKAFDILIGQESCYLKQKSITQMQNYISLRPNLKYLHFYDCNFTPELFLLISKKCPLVETIKLEEYCMRDWGKNKENIFSKLWNEKETFMSNLELFDFDSYNCLIFNEKFLDQCKLIRPSLRIIGREDPKDSVAYSILGFTESYTYDSFVCLECQGLLSEHKILVQEGWVRNVEHYCDKELGFVSDGDCIGFCQTCENERALLNEHGKFICTKCEEKIWKQIETGEIDCGDDLQPDIEPVYNFD